MESGGQSFLYEIEVEFQQNELVLSNLFHARSERGFVMPGRGIVSTVQPTQKTSVYKEPSTVEEAVALLKQNNGNAEISEKLLRKLKDMVDNGKNELFFSFNFVYR